MKPFFSLALTLLMAASADAGSLWHPLRLSLPALDRAPTISYTGRVVDRSTGRPVAGARVWPGDDSEAFVITDARGVYRLAWMPAVSDQIWVRAEGHLLFRRKFRPPSPWIVSPRVPTLAVWPARRLAGIVMRPDGRPVAGAEVRVFGHNPDVVQEITKTLSSDQGRFELAVIQDGDYEVMAASPGLAPAFENLTLGEGQAGISGIRLVLRQGRTAVGRVVDESDRPVAGARVVLRRNREDRLLLSDPAMEDVLFQATTDGDGRFEIPDLPAGWFDLEASQQGFLPERFQALEVEDDAGSLDLDTVRLRSGGEPDAESSALPDVVPDSRDPFERDRGPALSGRVLQADGVPAPHALVTFDDSWVRSYDPRTFWADADGHYRIEGLPTGERTVEARHDTLGWGRQEVEIAPGENHADITLETYEPRLARGQVVDPDGVPVAGALVEQGVVTVYTDARGDFAIQVDENGYELVARKAGYAPAYLSHWTTGGAREGLELRLGREASVSGRLLGLDPTDLDEARVSAIFLAFSEMQIPGRIRSDGTYHLQGLSPGEWFITANADGRPAGSTVTISPDEPDVELDLSFPDRAQVSGRVVDADGQPVEGADVRLVGPEEEHQAVTEEDGTFSLEVEDGTYEILAAQEGHALTRGGMVTVSGEPIEGLEIRLDRAAVLTGRLLGLSTEDLGEIQVRIELGSFQSAATLEIDEDSGEPPVYSFADLGPGEWTVRARVNAEETVRRVTVRPGDRTVKLDLPFAFGDLTLSGRVTGYRTIPSGGVAWLRKAGTGQSPWIVGISEGTFEFPRLRPGRYVLDLFDDRNKPALQREIDLTASQEIEIDLGDLFGD